MTTFSPTENPKRFYKKVSIEAMPGGYGVLLDERSVKTPARGSLTVPTEALAKALAKEWDLQKEYIDIAAMHLTRLANVAIDRAEETKFEMANEFARYCETDLICHIAEEPAELAAREEAIWRPVRDWAGETFGVFLVPVEGVIASPQPDASLNAAREHALSLDPFRLTGLMFGCGLLGSALLALAVEQDALSAEDAFEASRIDEVYQAEKWGEDEEAKAAAETRRSEILALGKWFEGLGRI